MPNRILKESICASDTIDALAWLEEVTFYRLIVNCDDYGRFDARPAILKAKLFPLKTVTEKTLIEAIDKLSSVGIVCVYVVNGKPYLQIITWSNHQTIRNKKSKYPGVEEGAQYKDLSEALQHLNAIASNRSQLHTNVPVIQSNPIQSKSNSKSESIMREADKSAPTQKAVIELTLNDNTQYPVTQEDINHWGELYPAVNILQELRNMQGWIEGNPTKRKTRRGMPRFITGWLSRVQNQGGIRYGYGNNGANQGNIGSPQERRPQYGTVL